MLSTLILLLSAALAQAQTKEEKTVALDAEQTLRQAEDSAAELMAKDLDSPLEFRFMRSRIESELKEYCDSIRRHRSIQTNCESKRKALASTFDKRQEALETSGKVDKFSAHFDRMESFESKYQDLRGLQEDGQNLAPDKLRRERLALDEAMAAYCPEAIRPDLAKGCLAAAKRIRNSLVDHEESIRSGGYAETPLSKRVYRNTKPVLRCFPDLPKIRDASLDYKISDPSGRYRYEHLTKSRFGYAIDIKLDELTKRDVNNPKRIQKKFSDPRNEKTYSMTVSTQFACAMGGPEKCRVDAISVQLSYAETPDRTISAMAGFPIKLDSSFELTLPLGEDEEEFRLSCMIASKARKGGWIYSDEAFEEK